MPLLNTCAACGATYTGRMCPKCPDCVPSEPGEAALLAPGQMFRGLEIVEELGRGGMGIVYKARQPALDRFVALKILPPERSRFVEFETRFEREARALAALSHPNIVTIYDSGKENDLFFFSMEMVEGSSLRRKIEGGKIPIEEVLRLALQICDALQFAHKQGVVHRDIKPDNILLDKEGRVKVADFGLAKLAETDSSGPMLTETNAVLGTAVYMAPEQMERTKDVDPRADVYSIGVMLYEMLTGRLPLGRSFDPPSRISRCDARLDAIVLKSMAREPKERYQTAAEMRADLEAARTHDGDTRADSKRLASVPEAVRLHREDPTRRLRQYVLVAELGAGGMGSVWKAWDTKLTRWVAVKFLNSADPESVRRFEREAQMAARLHHPNIAAVHEVNERDGRHYLVMDFIDGPAMGKTRMPLRATVETFAKVCRAMDYAHRNQIIHRDLKPPNIMLSKEGEPFVTDFGLAKLEESESSLSATGAVLGTPAYMSPEQATGRLCDVDSKSDIYSLGATLYVLLAGKPPFEAGNASAVIYKIVHEDAPSPRSINPEIPEAVERVILKAMSKEKRDRYAGAGEMAEDLQRYLQNQDVLARAPKRARRSPAVFAAPAAVLAAGGVIAFLVLLRPKDRPIPTPDPPSKTAAKSRFDPMKGRLAFSEFRSAAPEELQEIRKIASELPESESEEAFAWLRRQIDCLPESDWPRNEWTAKKPEARRISDWCAAILAVGDGFGSRFAPLREKLVAAEGRMSSVLAYRGRIRLKIVVWPYAEVRELRAGTVWIVQGGKRTAGDARVVGESLVTPVIIEEVDVGDYDVVLAHPQHGEVRCTLSAEGVEAGKSYILSGSLPKPDSLRLRPSP